jgi:hypothetical protein
MVGILPCRSKKRFDQARVTSLRIPVERGHEFEPLCCLKRQAVHVGYEYQQRNHGLICRQPELVGLLDGVDHVAGAVGKRHHFRAGRLRLQQIGTEIRGVQRMAYAAKHLSSGGLYRARSIGFQGMAEGIVDRDKEPAIAPFRDDRLGETGGERIAVIDPGCLRRRARLAGKGRASYRARDGDAVALRGELLDRERDG